MLDKTTLLKQKMGYSQLCPMELPAVMGILG